MTDQQPPDPQLTQDLVDQTAGTDPPDETYLEKVSRLNMAALQVNEMTRTPSLEPDDDCPIPPTRPADPTHPLNSEADRMTDQEFRAALEAWRSTAEYQEPAQRYAAWLQRRGRG